MVNLPHESWRSYGPAAEELLGGESIRPYMDDKNSRRIIVDLMQKGELLGPEFMKHNNYIGLYEDKVAKLPWHMIDAIDITNKYNTADDALKKKTATLSEEDISSSEDVPTLTSNSILLEFGDVIDQRLKIIKKLEKLGFNSDLHAKKAAPESGVVTRLLEEYAQLKERLTEIRAELPNSQIPKRLHPAINDRLDVEEQHYRFKKIQAYMGIEGSAIMKEAFIRYAIHAVPPGYRANGPEPTKTTDANGDKTHSEFITKLFDELWDQMDEKYGIDDADAHLYFYNSTQTPLDRFYKTDGFFVLGGELFIDGKSRVVAVDISANTKKPHAEGVIDLRIDGRKQVTPTVDDLIPLFTEKILNAIIAKDPKEAAIDQYTPVVNPKVVQKIKTDVIGNIKRIGLEDVIEGTMS